MGSWVTYGLGSESRNLPAFIVMSDPLDRGLPKGNASSGSGVFFRPSIGVRGYARRVSPWTIFVWLAVRAHRINGHSWIY